MFTSPLVIKEIAPNKWELVTPLTHTLVNVPKYFKTDLTTWYFEGKWTKSSVLHDYYLRYGNVSRGKADKIMRESMKDEGVDNFNYFIISFGLLMGNFKSKIFK